MKSITIKKQYAETEDLWGFIQRRGEELLSEFTERLFLHYQSWDLKDKIIQNTTPSNVIDTIMFKTGEKCYSPTEWKSVEDEWIEYLSYMSVEDVWYESPDRINYE